MHIVLIRRTWNTRTMGVTNVGITFPEIVDGRFTGKAGLQHVGHMTLGATAILANVNSPGTTTLVMMTTAAGLSLKLLGNRAACTVEEHDKALELIIDKLLAYAE